MENATFKLYLRTEYIKSCGKVPLYFQVTIKRRISRRNLGILVYPQFWDDKKKRVTRGDLEHVKKNIAIDAYQNRANDIVFKCKTESISLTLDYFLKEFEVEVTENYGSFCQFALNEIEADYKHKGSYDTYRTRKSAIKKIQEYAQKDVQFSDIDFGFLKKLDNCMIDKGNCESSRARLFKIMKAMFNRAIKQGKVKENPINAFKYKSKDGKRESLTIGEVKLLELLYKNPDTDRTIKKALQPFLFCCFTGLRFKDIYNLRQKNIVSAVDSNGNEAKMLKFVMHKTKEYQEIPLNKSAISLLPPQTFSEDYVFRVYTNQPQNRYLKSAVTKVGIHKKITFHCARHTLATLLMPSTDIITIKEFLGHQDIRTTQIYTKSLMSSKITAANAIDIL